MKVASAKRTRCYMIPACAPCLRKCGFQKSTAGLEIKYFRSFEINPRTHKNYFWFAELFFVRKVSHRSFSTGLTKNIPFEKTFPVRKTISVRKWSFLVNFGSFGLFLGHLARFGPQECFSVRNVSGSKCFRSFRAGLAKKTKRTEKLLRKKCFCERKTFWLEKQKLYFRNPCIVWKYF